MPTGVLGNSHVPFIGSKNTVRELNRLSGETLFNLARLWLSMRQTAPSRDRDNHLNKIVEQKNEYGNNKSLFKRKLIDYIIVEMYPKGLNALQLAQIDVQSLIDKPNIYSWGSASTRGTQNEPIIVKFDPQTFLNKFISNLSNLYLCHIYISRHPRYPMYLIRVQIFDHTVQKRSSSRKVNTKRQFDLYFKRFQQGKQLKRPETHKSVNSLKPYYILLPLSTPNVIYTTNNMQTKGPTQDIEDLSLRLLLQTLERTLSSFDKPVVLNHEGKMPIKNLNSVFILKANSRFSNSLGPWLPYADNKVDGEVLSDGTDNFRIQVRRIVGTTDDVAALRFRGSTTSVRSQVYDTNDERSPAQVEDEQEDVNDGVVPIEEFEHTLANGMRLKFTGSDIFGGLLELSRDKILDAKTCPAWLTGEEMQL